MKEDEVWFVHFNPPIPIGSERYKIVRIHSQKFIQYVLGYALNDMTITSMSFTNRDAALQFKLGLP